MRTGSLDIHMSNAGADSFVWLLLCAQLVFFMTIPGLALFYGGLVRSKNVLSMLVQCFAIAAIMILLWVGFGYSLSFGDGGVLQPVIGNFDYAFLSGMYQFGDHFTGYKLAYLLYQMGFAIITPALITGGFAERMKFSALVIFMIAWAFLVYFPITHWVWGGGWLQQLGILDFAGGTVVHVNAGIAGLVTAFVLGRRKVTSIEELQPHNITLVAIGTGILWFGWVGFNSGGAPDFHRVVMAVLVTNVAAAAGGVTWMFVDWLRFRRASILSFFFGCITGLVAITPASGFVGVVGALLIGVIASAASTFIASMKHRYGYDDALDAFGVHGFGGIVGSLLTGIFAAAILGGIGLPSSRGIPMQVAVQLTGTCAAIVWSGGWTYLILKVMRWCQIPLRITEQEEESGLDITYHGEKGYKL